MKKNNLVTMGVSFLLCVGMVGAGFASWVISAGVEEDLESTVKVESVIDQRLKIATRVKPVDSKGDADGSGEVWDADLYFGAPKDQTGVTTPWLSYQPDEKDQEPVYEDLDVYLDITLNYPNLKLLSEQDLDVVDLTLTLDKKNLLSTFTQENAYLNKTLLDAPAKIAFTTKDENETTIVSKKANPNGQLSSEIDYQEINLGLVEKEKDVQVGDSTVKEKYWDFRKVTISDDGVYTYVSDDASGAVALGTIDTAGNANGIFGMDLDIGHLLYRAETAADAQYKLLEAPDGETDDAKAQREAKNALITAAKEAYLDMYEFRYIFKFTYKWGTFFENKNPFNFFNSHSSSARFVYATYTENGEEKNKLYYDEDVYESEKATNTIAFISDKTVTYNYADTAVKLLTKFLDVNAEQDENKEYLKNYTIGLTAKVL